MRVCMCVRKDTDRQTLSKGRVPACQSGHVEEIGTRGCCDEIMSHVLCRIARVSCVL